MITVEMFERDGSWCGVFGFDTPTWKNTAASKTIHELFADGGYVKITSFPVASNIREFTKTLREAFNATNN